MSFVANGQFSLIPYNEIRPKTETDDGAKGVKSSFIQLSSDAISEATLTYFTNEEGDGRGALWQKKFTLALADNTHDLDEDFTDCERSGADRATKFWSKFAFTMAVAGGFNEGTIAGISETTNPLNYLQTNCSYLNRIPRARLSDENYCTLGVMHDAIRGGQGNFYIISLAPDDKRRMGDACTDLSSLLYGFKTADMGIPVIIDTSKSFTKMVEVFNNREEVKQSDKFCYMRTAASIADPSTTPGVDNMVDKFGVNNVYCEYLEGERVVAADDLVGNVKITYTNLQFNSISSNNRDQVTATYAIIGGPLQGKSDARILVANTGPKHFNSINYVKSEFLIAQRGLAANPVFAYPETLFRTQILGGRAQFYDEFNAMLNGAEAIDVVKTLMKTYTMGCARKRTSDAAQGDDCDKLPSLKFHKLNLDGKSLKTEGEGVKMTTKGVMVTIDRLLFARQVAKCPGAAAILDSGTHMIVYIPGEGAAVKVAEGKVEPVEQAASKEVATIEKERAPPKRPEPLTPDEKIAINNKLRDERRFRRAANTLAAAQNKARAAVTGADTAKEEEAVVEEAGEKAEKAEETAAGSWVDFFDKFFQFENFFKEIGPAGSDAGKGGANTRESQLDGLYQTGGDPTADDLDLSTILSYLYVHKDGRTEFYGKFAQIIDQIRKLFGEGFITFKYYNDQTHNAVYMCNRDRDEYIDSYLDGLRAADSVDPFGTGKVGKTHYKTEAEVIFHIVYWGKGKTPAADFSIVRYNNKTYGPSMRCVGGGWDNWYNPSLKNEVRLKAIFDAANGGEEPSAAEFLTGDPSDAAPSPSPSDGASADMGGGASPSITSIFRAPFNTLSSTENLSETNIAVMNSLLNMLCNYETSFINYREGRDAFYNIINDGFPLKMLPNIVMASSVEVSVFVKLMLDDYTADRAKTINYGLFEYYLYSQKDNNYIYTCLQDIKDYILGTNMYYISPTETDIIPDETRAYFEDLCTRTVSLSGQIYSQTYDLTNTGDYEAIYQLASDNYLTMGGFHELSEIFMTKTGEILKSLPSDVLAKYGEQVTEAVEESKREEKADVGKGIGYFLPRGPTNRVPSQVQARPPTGAGGANTNLKKSIKKHRTRKLTRGKKRDNGKKHTRKRGIKRRHHTKRKF
jgi:hypothetical protein